MKKALAIICMTTQKETIEKVTTTTNRLGRKLARTNPRFIHAAQQVAKH